MGPSPFLVEAIRTKSPQESKFLFSDFCEDFLIFHRFLSGKPIARKVPFHDPVPLEIGFIAEFPDHLTLLVIFSENFCNAAVYHVIIISDLYAGYDTGIGHIISPYQIIGLLILIYQIEVYM